MLQPPQQFLRERRQVIGLAQPLSCDPAGFTQRHDARDILGPGPAALLLAGADQHGGQLQAAPLVERANALRGIELVPGDRQQVDAERVDLHHDLAERLSNVGMDERAMPFRGARDFRDRLQRADLVLRMDDADERGGVVDRRRDRLGGDATVWPWRHPADLVPFALQQGAARLRRRMLDCRGDERAPLRIAPSGAADRDVARLGAAAGEGDFVSARADQRGDLCARVLDRIMRAPPRGMCGGRVAEFLAQERQHGVEHGRIDRRGGIVIEVDRLH